MRFLLACCLLSSVSYAKEVSIPIRYFPGSLDVAKLVHVDQNRIASLVSRSLFSFGKNFKIRPEAAKSFQWTQDGLHLRIELRDAHFSDGSKMSSKIVKKSLERCILLKKSVVSVGFEKILGYDKFIKRSSSSLEGIKVNDANSISISLSERAPLILDRLAHSACSIVKSSSNGRYDMLNGALGTGPYVFFKKSPNSITLAKNSHFNGSTSGPDKVKFVETQFIGNPSKLLEWADLVVNDGPTIRKKNFNSHRYSQLGSHLFIFNNSQGIFRSRKARQAVSSAMNIERVIEIMDWDRHRAQAGLIPFGLRGFKRRKILFANPTKANKILAAMGYSATKPMEFEILIAKNAKAPKEIQAWSVAFQGSYIKPILTVLPQKELMKRRNEGNFDVLRLGKAPGSVDPYLIFVSLMSGGVYNTPKADYPKCDKLINEALKEIDIDSRHILYKKCERCFMDEFVVVPLASFKRKQALIRKPWKFLRTNQYLLKPYFVFDWKDN